MIRKIIAFLKKVGFKLGDIISSLFLVLFYFTVFMLFAVPFKIVHYLKSRKAASYYTPPQKTEFAGIKDFKDEY